MNLDKSDADKGVYAKFKVTRTDRSTRKGGRHAHCAHFVLDLNHDPFAIPALKAYANACRKQFPALARDLDRVCLMSDPNGEFHRILRESAARNCKEEK